MDQVKASGRQGFSFTQAMQDGAKIVEFHEVQRKTYQVKVATMNGEVHKFSCVNADVLRQYKPDFEEGDGK
ncbi:hypothetical protein HDV00_005614 [Rhizophlyctis rosea]|nr:hypothetical protein HDV00_005614 [Rhizophlyctis rosea]